MWVYMLSINISKTNEDGLKIIKDIRKKKSTKVVRKFAPPQEIDFKAKSYVDLIDWRSYTPKNFASPPILHGMSLEDIRDKKISAELLKVPCHSQHVERHVYLTTQASQAAIGQEARHAFIINKEVATKKIKKGDCIEAVKRQKKE